MPPRIRSDSASSTGSTRFVLNNNISPNQPVSRFLSQEVFKMKNQLNEELSCSICLESICCDKCYCLLLCGHGFHFVCISSQNICALCRA